eukprot:5761492-Pyramimonas_sp.AAC.1
MTWTPLPQRFRPRPRARLLAPSLCLTIPGPRDTSPARSDYEQTAAVGLFRDARSPRITATTTTTTTTV